MNQAKNRKNNQPRTKAVLPLDAFILAVPRSARGLKLAELPLSVRLDGVLEQCGYRTLGDLDKVDIRVLLALKNCGQTSIAELRELLRRAADGEFSPVAKKDLTSNLQELAQAIDHGFGQLSKRDRRIYETRLVGKNGRRQTLRELGTENDMTRERVRQIVREGTQRIRREGGPKFVRALEAVAAECKKRGVPLTLHQLSEWFGKCSGLRHSPQFYVGMLYHTDHYWMMAGSVSQN